MKQFIRVTHYVPHMSLTQMEEQGLDISDNGVQVDGFYAAQQQEFILRCLTPRQRKIALQLMEGYSRKEVAQREGIVLQAVHEMVLRMRKRLIKKARQAPTYARRENY